MDDVKKTFERIMKETSKYNTRENAYSSLEHRVEPGWVMLGDDGCYWVTTPANCAKLERMGYEYAK